MTSVRFLLVLGVLAAFAAAMLIASEIVAAQTVPSSGGLMIAAAPGGGARGGGGAAGGGAAGGGGAGGGAAGGAAAGGGAGGGGAAGGGGKGGGAAGGGGAGGGAAGGGGAGGGAAGGGGAGGGAAGGGGAGGAGGGAAGGGGAGGAGGGAAGGGATTGGTTREVSTRSTGTDATTTSAAPKPPLPPRDDPTSWSVYVTNDDCPDYTWGLTEAATIQAYADIVKAHLDLMTRTDKDPPSNQDRYNAAVTGEVLALVEKYPARKDELVRRIKEGRLFVSPYLCNSLWGFQSTEAAVRTFYPARRLEIAWGLPPAACAEHIELPSLPWGTASILTGCGIRWLSVPFYNYDSTFSGLTNPPLFLFEGPDGSRLRVAMDPWAGNRASYTQGAKVLGDPATVLKDWLPHFLELGCKKYPAREILASGTHGDISPTSGAAAAGFAEAIVNYNASAGPHPNLVNATLPMFTAAVDEAERDTPFLPIRRGDFGHSWDVWPVSLARIVADMREGERQFLAAEALLAMAASATSSAGGGSAMAAGSAAAAIRDTAAARERAEWCWAMLSDHAWNGTDEANQRANAGLRQKWTEELSTIGKHVAGSGWNAAGLEADSGAVTLFNGTSVPRADLVRCEVPAGVGAAKEADRVLASQVSEEQGKRVLTFVAPAAPGYAMKTFGLGAPLPITTQPPFRVTATELEGPFYKLTVDPATGGISSLVLKATGTAPGMQLVAAKSGRTLGQTVYWRGKEEAERDVKSEVVAVGSVFARLKITSTVGDADVTTYITVYAALDRVDFDVRIHKPVATTEERMLQMFPIVQDRATLRADTTGAVVRPRPQPQGDLLAGADARRLAVQGFIDASVLEGPGVTVAPIDAFCLRLDQDAPAFEALGNDQNYKEVTKDQNGVTEFRFRYALRGHAGPYNPAETAAWSRGVAAPLVVVAGRLKADVRPPLEVDPARAVALALKPALDEKAGGIILRLAETTGKSGPLAIKVAGFKRAVRTDLLERDQEELKIVDGTVTVDLRANGFAAVRLLP